MTKYFEHNGKTYKAVLWIATNTMGFSVVEWPDFEWSEVGVYQVKPIFHREFPIRKIQDIDHYIDEWKQLNKPKT